MVVQPNGARNEETISFAVRRQEIQENLGILQEVLAAMQE